MIRSAAVLLVCLLYQGTAADLRLSANNPIILKLPNGSSTSLSAGGRVGNWRPDLVSPGGVLVFDGPVAQAGSPFKTDIYTIPVPTAAPYSGQLTRLSATWSGASALASNTYVGNAWFCPTSDTQHPENEFILFQAQDKNSQITSNANPGIGLDNQVWIYRPIDKKVWQLTFYTELFQLTPTLVPGGGVLGPQCSEDSDSSSNTLHIVYAHIIQAVPNGFANTTGPSTEQTAWFGNWELVYADIKFTNGDPDCSGTGETPCFTNIVKTNPRDLDGGPLSLITGTDGVVSSGTCSGGSYKLNSSSQNLSGVVPGAGVQFGSSFPYSYSIVSSVIDPHNLCLVYDVPAPYSNFTVQNMNYIEPHRYVSNGGDLYYSTNSLYILHDSVGARFNVSGSSFQALNAGYPPGTTPAPGFNGNVAQTWFNEFLTPYPNFFTTTTPKPIGRSIFMSDRSMNSSYYSLVPEYSDHYMCGGPNCQMPFRLTEYNNPDGSPGPDSTCGSSCTVVVATRGAWSPSGTQYLTMNQYIEPVSRNSYAELHLYQLQYPSLELGGHAVLSGRAVIH